MVFLSLGPNQIQVTDSKNKKYTIEKMPQMAEHNYSIKDTKGHYAVIKFDGDKWTENGIIPFYQGLFMNLSEIGNLIKNIKLSH